MEHCTEGVIVVLPFKYNKNKGVHIQWEEWINHSDDGLILCFN